MRCCLLLCRIRISLQEIFGIGKLKQLTRYKMADFFYFKMWSVMQLIKLKEHIRTHFPETKKSQVRIESLDKNEIH